MLSRVAASLYSAARLVERTDHLARLLDVNATVHLDRYSPRAEGVWDRFLALAGVDAPAGTRGDAAIDLTLAAIRTHAAGARRLALSVRPSISTEVFEQVNILHWRLQEDDRRDLHGLLAATELGVNLVWGLVDDSMAHDDAFAFMQLGKSLERAVNVVRFVTRQLAELAPGDTVLWGAALRSCWAFEAYRRRYAAPVTPDRVAGFLLLDRVLPRSAAFNVATALEAVGRIEGSPVRSGPQRVLGRLVSLFDYAEPSEITSGFAAFAAEFADLAGRLERELAASYFQPTSMAAPLPTIVAPYSEQQQQQQQGRGRRG